MRAVLRPVCSRPWNLKGERAVGGARRLRCGRRTRAAPGRWAASAPHRASRTTGTASASTADLVRRAGGWVTRHELNKDPDLRNRSTVGDHEFDRLVRNVYKVLLTRGMVGTVITSVDPETQDLLAGPLRRV